MRLTRTKLKWQPIETAPTDGTVILVWDGFNVMVARYLILGTTEMGPFGDWVCDGLCAEDPTQWMPLPAPPEP